ncbi:MAG: large conductance mechanosensitive channel protein MscL [Oligoflexia bacterium]|nr:large conductance mechanosensitive channel protein MscL [Oligoflexia bacterium]
MTGFKKFLLRGNVIELAVAVVIGAAFGGVVTAFVRDLLTPLIAALAGQPDFSSLTFTINGSQFRYGDFINALLSFLLVAGAVYFFVVVPLGRLQKPRAGAPALIRKCPECLSEIPNEARRCAHCGQQVASITQAKVG